jgi:hypothetical protein
VARAENEKAAEAFVRNRERLRAERLARETGESPPPPKKKQAGLKRRAANAGRPEAIRKLLSLI